MKNLIENFEVGDLKNVLTPKIHIDEFKSVLGQDDDILVLSFLVNDKQAAIDLVDFFERGYEFVLDCDVSDSELRPGSYLVFMEILRRRKIIKQIYKILSDLSAASSLNINDWKFRYMNEEKYHKLTPMKLKQYVPLYPKAYRERFFKPIEDMKALSGLPTESKDIILDPLIEQIMLQAGIPYVSKNNSKNFSA